MKKIEELILDDNGKDDRLKILDNDMTKYGCKAYPYNHISYSSCTASTIDLESFTYIEHFYNNKNLLDPDIYIEEFQNIRDDLRKIIGLEDDVDICLASSGTDLELLPYMFFPINFKVLNIVIAPNEVGSGTALAVEGKIFSNIDNKLYNYKKGDVLKGFENFDINVVNLNIRDKSGNEMDDDIVIKQIEKYVNSNRDSYKIIHSVYHSKTGLIKPLPEKLLHLKDEKTLIVVDACQFRISREKINELLNSGCIVFVTGSKFFAAPTFSAGALIPHNLRDKAAFNPDIPIGLNFLFGKEFFPKRWKSIDNFEYGNNQGLLLRWRAAIFEMQLFNSISQEKIKNTINILNACINELFIKYPEFKIYSDIYENESDYDKLMSNTILTFGFKNKNIDIEKAKEIYQELISNDWLNKSYPYPIHLGQPVKIIKENDRWLGTLRIAVSCKFFVNYSGKIKNIQKEIICKELDYIFEAIQLINKAR